MYFLKGFQSKEYIFYDAKLMGMLFVISSSSCDSCVSSVVPELINMEISRRFEPGGEEGFQCTIWHVLRFIGKILQANK